MSITRSTTDHHPPHTAAVHIPTGAGLLDGDLTVPDSATGIVLFAHGSGSSRHSPRNRAVAQSFHQRGLATLLMDLLTPDEEAIDEHTRHIRFDIALLADRLTAALRWLSTDNQTRGLLIGLFGASTGAAAALVSAASEPALVAAVVSRGGRPDLAGEALQLVRCPTLLIVGGRDELVIDLNREAMSRMRAPASLAIVPGAAHLFEERGALDQVASLAGDWFAEHLQPGQDHRPD